MNEIEKIKAGLAGTLNIDLSTLNKTYLIYFPIYHILRIFSKQFVLTNRITHKIIRLQKTVSGVLLRDFSLYILIWVSRRHNSILLQQSQNANSPIRIHDLKSFFSVPAWYSVPVYRRMTTTNISNNIEIPGKLSNWSSYHKMLSIVLK